MACGHGVGWVSWRRVLPPYTEIRRERAKARKEQKIHCTQRQKEGRNTQSLLVGWQGSPFFCCFFLVVVLSCLGLLSTLALGLCTHTQHTQHAHNTGRPAHTARSALLSRKTGRLCTAQAASRGGGGGGSGGGGGGGTRPSSLKTHTHSHVKVAVVRRGWVGGWQACPPPPPSPVAAASAAAAAASRPPPPFSVHACCRQSFSLGFSLHMKKKSPSSGLGVVSSLYWY